MSVSASFVAPVTEEITQSVNQVRMKLISQLIKGTSRVTLKLLKYFNGTTILITFLLPEGGIFPVIFNLDLHDSEITIAACASSL